MGIFESGRYLFDWKSERSDVRRFEQIIPCLLGSHWFEVFHETALEYDGGDTTEKIVACTRCGLVHPNKGNIEAFELCYLVQGTVAHSDVMENGLEAVRKRRSREFDEYTAAGKSSGSVLLELRCSKDGCASSQWFTGFDEDDCAKQSLLAQWKFTEGGKPLCPKCRP